MQPRPAPHGAKINPPRPPRLESRAQQFERHSAEAFAALQLAAMDAIDTVRLIAGAVEMLEASTTIDPDERTSIVARLQEVPAMRAERAAATTQKRTRADRWPD